MSMLARLLALLVVCCAILGSPAARVSAAEPTWAERVTGHLIVRSSGGDGPELQWYADVAEAAYLEICDIFGVPPRQGIVVNLYADDAAYAAANPIAGDEEAILGHARPTDGEIGLATGRLRGRSEGLKRASVRHELAHIVLGEMSGQALPVGLQEGLAQYVERDPDQRPKMMQTLRKGLDAGQLLSLADLNRQRPFLARAGLAYPESYAVVGVLSERHGFDSLVRLVSTLRERPDLGTAVQTVYGHSLAELDEEWRAALPAYLDGGWQRNDLDLWDLAGPRQQLVDGAYAEAQDGYARAERLFTGLGRDDRAEQARTEGRRASLGLEGAELLNEAAAAFGGFEYERAETLFRQAEERWSEVGDDRWRSLAGYMGGQAQHGLAATAQLADAHRALDGWRFQEAESLAYEAGGTFADLGDGERLDEARRVIVEAGELRTQLGLGALGGAATISALTLGWAVRRRRSAPSPTTRVTTLERDWSL